MLEISATPILPTALTQTNAPPASSGGAAPTENAKLSGTDTANSTTDQADSFASVLQRQVDQAAAQAKSNAATPAEPTTQSLLEVPLTFGPTEDPAIELLPEDDTVPVATSLTAATSLNDLLTKGADRPDKPADDSPQETSDATGAAQMPYLFGMGILPPVKLETKPETAALVDAEAGTETAGMLQLSAANRPTIDPNLSDGKSAWATKLAETAQGAASKTAEIAVALDKATDAAANNTPHPSASTENSFDSLLAAAQAFHQNRSAATQSAGNASSVLPVHTPVNAHGWDGEVGDKLVWMIGRQEQRAELVLNPPQLGRVEVSLTMSAGQTSALFVSANPAVRDALEAAMPRLREILSDAGVTLGQTQVGADTGSNGTANQSTNNRENWDNSGRTLNRMDLADGLDNLRPVAPTQWLKQGNGLVDVFA